MATLPASLERLITELSKLPGVGSKTATRYAFHLLRESDDRAELLASAIREVRATIRRCERCCNITEDALCSICADTRRDQGLICVVEDVPDLMAIERTAQFDGVYHVLQGVLAPLRGVGPEDLTLDRLLARVQAGGVREIIVATNVGVEGEATGLYIHHTVASHGVTVSRIASGIPMGGDLEYIDQVTIARALEGRRNF